jgi:hypothetical protein
MIGDITQAMIDTRYGNSFGRVAGYLPKNRQAVDAWLAELTQGPRAQGRTQPRSALLRFTRFPLHSNTRSRYRRWKRTNHATDDHTVAVRVKLACEHAELRDAARSPPVRWRTGERAPPPSHG